MHFTVTSLEEVFPLAEFLSDAFGPMAEIAVHDLDRPHASIVFIRNGHLSGRKKGDSMTKETLELTRKARDSGIDFISDYRGHDLNDHQFRVSSFFIRDKEDEVIGALCININITELQRAAHLLQTISETDSVNGMVTSGIPSQELEENPEENIRRVTREVIKQVHIPIDKLSRIERLAIIKDLKDRGIFLIKGAVGVVAPELKVSVPTLYRYLQSLK